MLGSYPGGYRRIGQSLLARLDVTWRHAQNRCWQPGRVTRNHGPVRALPGPGRPEQRGRSSGRVLVLNASFEPINVCTVRRAAVLILKNRAEVLEHGEWALHAESLSLPRPVVIRLLAYVRIPRDAHRRKITRRAVFARDRWTCQYCGHERGNLTVDHVIPRSKGGSSSWDNIVTCCAPCNRRKGDRLPAAGEHGARRAGRGRPAPRSSSTSRPRASPRRGSSTWWPPDGPLAPRRPPARPAGSAFPPSGAAVTARAATTRADPSPGTADAASTRLRPAAGRPPAAPGAPSRAAAAAAGPRRRPARRRPARRRPWPPPSLPWPLARPRPGTATAAPRPEPPSDRPARARRRRDRPATVADLRSLRRWLVVAGGLGRGGHRDRRARVPHRERRRRAAARRDRAPRLAASSAALNRRSTSCESQLKSCACETRSRAPAARDSGEVPRQDRTSPRLNRASTSCGSRSPRAAAADEVEHAAQTQPSSASRTPRGAAAAAPLDTTTAGLNR